MEVLIYPIEQAFQAGEDMGRQKASAQGIDSGIRLASYKPYKASSLKNIIHEREEEKKANSEWHSEWKKLFGAEWQ